MIAVFVAVTAEIDEHARVHVGRAIGAIGAAIASIAAGGVLITVAIGVRALANVTFSIIVRIVLCGVVHGRAVVASVANEVVVRLIGERSIRAKGQVSMRDVIDDGCGQRARLGIRIIRQQSGRGRDL